MSPSNLKSSVVWIAEFLPSASLYFLITLESRWRITGFGQMFAQPTVS
ncbi:hypothetical protein SynBIOSU31_01397 [Synechococcus sp. BIOS-U3-1]|nr:hypothetical protein SynBIOSU31_01397 [Synechococcus sp. BIOS-U3-1]